jgi:hypothetical protein
LTRATPIQQMAFDLLELECRSSDAVFQPVMKLFQWFTFFQGGSRAQEPRSTRRQRRDR